MSYATEENISSMFREVDFAATDAAVDSTDISLFLDNTTAIINAKIGTLYTLPIVEVDHPESFKILKQLQMYMVACIVDDILNNYDKAEKKPGWCKKAETLMHALVPDREKCKQCKPTMILPDAEYLGTDTEKARIKISATTGVTFRKGEKNW